ncbi:hypothetical protein 1 [Rhabdoviridae sp.]|uniref:Uncharacterized protein n=1 Tax=Rattus tanezumi rhabdovirus 1 TaxID=3071238 RepID=A0A858HUW3_9RHAB|nr:hypothetical protein 1 [Rhabdoviridae sp.]QIM74097.1 hypothetical protein 1 [Rhabdoviridae sp.]QIM74102.1 hypothetical protein 1 [Rattus tanezumi rhabdovirus 1]
MSTSSRSSFTVKSQTPPKGPTRAQMKNWDTVAAVHAALTEEAMIQGGSSDVIEDLDDSLLVDPSEYASPPRIRVPRDVIDRGSYRPSHPLQRGAVDPGVVEFTVPIQEEIHQDLYEKIVLDTILRLESLNMFRVGNTIQTPQGLKVQLKKHSIIPSSGTSSSEEGLELQAAVDVETAALTSKQQTQYYQTRDQIRDLASTIPCPIKMVTHMGVSMFVNWKKMISNPEQDFLQTALHLGPDRFLSLKDDQKIHKVIAHVYPKNPVLRNLSLDYLSI